MGEFFLLFILFCWIFPCAKHYFFVRYRFNKYMTLHHKVEWIKMKRDLGLYYPAKMHFYYSKPASDFIWKSNEDFEDKNIQQLRCKIKRIRWEFPLWLVLSILTIVLSIWMGNKFGWVWVIGTNHIRP